MTVRPSARCRGGVLGLGSVTRIFPRDGDRQFLPSLLVDSLCAVPQAKGCFVAYKEVILHKLNSEEYEALREELHSVRNCITTFVGFVLGGSAAASLGLARLGGSQMGTSPPFILIAITSLTLALTGTVVLIILQYKFISHNRYAGYCKLLTQERYEGITDPVFGWEVCLEQLRFSDFNSRSTLEFLRTEYPSPSGLTIPTQVDTAAQADPNPMTRPLELVDKEAIATKFNEFGGPRPTADRAGKRRGLWAIYWGLLGHTMSTGWGFPVYVVIITLSMTLLFASMCALTTFQALREDHVSTKVGIAVGLVLLLLIYIWAKGMAKLSNLLGRSRSINAFCWKFIPFRFRLLTALGATNYGVITGIPGDLSKPVIDAEKDWEGMHWYDKMRIPPGTEIPKGKVPKKRVKVRVAPNGEPSTD